ncbi:MAG: RsmE family RNA methyltransferase, partial [Reichenbachiella sp.]
MNFYYHPAPKDEDILSKEESAHAIKVLRMKIGDIIYLMDGNGGQYEASITDANHRKCGFKLIKKTSCASKPYRTHIAIAPTKSVDRLEWFVEKACELGVDEISFLNTQRSERSKINLER